MRYWVCCHKRVSFQNLKSCNIATPGKAYQLLKKGAKLRKNRGVPKKYTANLKILLWEPYDGDDHSKNNKKKEEEKEL